MAKPKFLSEQLIKDIRFSYFDNKCTQKQISDFYGISQSTISKIVNNHIHKPPIGLTLSGEAETKVGYKYGN